MIHNSKIILKFSLILVKGSNLSLEVLYIDALARSLRIEGEVLSVFTLYLLELDIPSFGLLFLKHFRGKSFDLAELSTSWSDWFKFIDLFKDWEWLASAFKNLHIFDSTSL